MSNLLDKSPFSSSKSELVASANLLWEISAERRPGVLARALAGFPETSLEASFSSGPLRAALSSAWEQATRKALPIDFLRCHLAKADDLLTKATFRNLAVANSRLELEADLAFLIGTLIQVHADQCHNGERGSEIPAIIRSHD